ncbi:hypothetical protein ACFL0U_03170 [Pseudomonadota bacterium]
MNNKNKKSTEKQKQLFKDTAKKLECNESEKEFDSKMKKVIKQEKCGTCYKSKK